MGNAAVQARREIESEVRGVVEKAVLPAVGAPGHRFDLIIPTLGRSSLVFLVDVEDADPFVVRVARGSRGRKDLQRRIQTSRFWARHGAPTPEVLHADVSRRARRDGGFYWLCEQRILGRNAVDLAEGEPGFEAVGRAFARVHAVERRWHHGSFHQPRIGPYGYRQVKRHAEWTRSLFDMGLAPEALTRTHRDWLAGFPGVHAGGPFQLIHRRCTESDVMLDEGGEAWVLEPQRCGFGSFLTDLIRIEERIGRADEERIRGLHRGYFGAVAQGRRDVYDALAPVFRADLHLSNALRWARKMRGGAEGAEAEFVREFDRYRKITGA